MRYSGSSVTGLLIVVVGCAILLDNMGLFGANIVLADYFPLIFSFYGALWLARCSRPDHMIWPGIMIAGGVLGTLANLRVIHLSFHQLWPLILIGVGVSMLLGRTTLMRRLHRRPLFDGELHFAAGSRSSSSTATLDEIAVFGEIRRIITSLEFTGGSVKVSFGAVKLDLRKAGIASGTEAVVDCSVAFGGIEFKVPEMWRVVWQGSAVFGGFDDKTLPPRPEPGVKPPTLILTGTAAFGGIEVRN